MRRFVPLALLALLLNGCGLFLRKTGIKNYTLPEKISGKGMNDYQYDFIYLTKLIETGFPMLDSIFPRQERDELAEIIYNRLQHTTSDREFILLSGKYLSRLNNEHSYIYMKSDPEPFFPYEVFISQNAWYLINIPSSMDSMHIGKKITSINGLPIEDIDRRLRELAFAENNINKQYELRVQRFYNRPSYLKEAGILRDSGDTLALLLNDQTEIRLCTVSPKNPAAMYRLTYPEHPLTRLAPEKTYFCKIDKEKNLCYLQFNHCHDSIDVMDNMENYVKPWVRPLARAYLIRQFNKKKPSRNVSGYYNREHPVFSDFVWNMVDSLNEHHIDTLIIDLRNNPGGNLTLGIQLLYFLTEKDSLKDFKAYAYTTDIYRKYFTKEYDALLKTHSGNVPDNALVRANPDDNLFSAITDKQSRYYVPPDRPVFRGKVILFANYRTGSAAAMLTTLFQDNGIGTVIGTSVGNNPIGPTIWTPMQLPKTKARISLSTSYIERPKKEKGPVQIPDTWIEYTTRDLFSPNDPFLEAIESRPE